MVAIGMVLLLFRAAGVCAQPAALDRDDVAWRRPGGPSGRSMPVGGGDIGMNVWVEHGDLLLYLSRPGAFDEHNTLLKLGRIRVRLSPDLLDSGRFLQRLHLRDGSLYIHGERNGLAVRIHLWAEVFRPVVHLEVRASRPVTAQVSYESWRAEDRVVQGKENDENSYRFAPQGVVQVYRDQIGFQGGGVLFYHRNKDTTIFDATVAEQGLDSVKGRLHDPLGGLTFGGLLTGDALVEAGTGEGSYLHTPYKAWILKDRQPVQSQEFTVYLHTAQTSLAEWHEDLGRLIRDRTETVAARWRKNCAWWSAFWKRSYIVAGSQRDTGDLHWQAARNYQLFRYMLACNARGAWPTKFNGGLFTFDPAQVDPKDTFTPDFRRWGGGTFTQQNQRLVYDPMLASGDTDMLRVVFDFYRRLLPAAELRTRVYWHHPGACFTEQLENFGLPNCSEYGWKRPVSLDPGMQDNKWLSYLWDTALEFCQMILEARSYFGMDIHPYLPLVKSCLAFFDFHYRYLAGQRGTSPLDASGHLVLFPGSAAETYKVARNASSTIAALRTLTVGLLRLPSGYLSAEDTTKLRHFLSEIPSIPFRRIDGRVTIAPARSWERIQNTETPQLYPVFPWHLYGLGHPGLDTALDTWRYDTDALAHRSFVGWKQDNLFAACLGLTREADSLTLLKLRNGPWRFPAFWGPGFDWAPDHNWGGSGMLGLQEMLLQTAGRRILLFPAWPQSVNVRFKLHAPGGTVVEAALTGGRVTMLRVTPASRKKDVINMLSKHASPTG